MIGIVTVLAAGALSILPTAPTTAAPDLQGVWQGTIGTLPVRACFVQRDDFTFGAYYYLSRLRLIPLDREGNGSGPFHEGVESGAKSPRWTLGTVGAGALSGSWTRGARTLPIRLTRVGGGADDESPCASLLFHGPRLAGTRIVSQPATKDGVAYTKLVLDHRGRFEDTSVTTFALDGATEAVRRINAKLRGPLAGNPPGWFECVRGSLETHSLEGEINETIEPRLITARWLTAMDHEDGDCGGAHPNSGDLPLTFDRTTGREVDLHDWLNDKAVKREAYGPGREEAKLLQPAFRDLLLAGWKSEDSDCVDAVRQEDFWTIALTRTGLVFAPELPHVAQACTQDFTMSFARLRPYLSAEGAKEVAALQAH